MRVLGSKISENVGGRRTFDFSTDRCDLFGAFGAISTRLFWNGEWKSQQNLGPSPSSLGAVSQV